MFLGSSEGAAVGLEGALDGFDDGVGLGLAVELALDEEDGIEDGYEGCFVIRLSSGTIHRRASGSLMPFRIILLLHHMCTLCL